MISINAMVKDAGYRTLKITPTMLGELAESIQKNGFEWVSLVDGPIAIVGFVVEGKQTGERIIILGSKVT